MCKQTYLDVKGKPDYSCKQKWQTSASYFLTLLHLAIKNNMFDIAELLVDKGATLSIKNKNGKTALDFLTGNEPKKIK